MKLLFGITSLLLVSYTSIGDAGIFEETNILNGLRNKNDLTCAVCKSLMELLDAYLTDEPTEQGVADALAEICSLLPPPLDLECFTMIEEYTDDIIELIVNQYLAPGQVCEALSLCP